MHRACLKPSRAGGAPQNVCAQHAGFALVEIMLSAGVLAMGVLGLFGALVASARLAAENRETALAHQAARAMCERMQATPFAQIFATYNTDPSDDPGGPGTAPGASFAVAGLEPAQAGAGVKAGEIFFPTIALHGTAVALCESVSDPALGMPRDLNGDGRIDAGALTGHYLVLPVRVRVRWRGFSGERSLELASLLIAR